MDWRANKIGLASMLLGATLIGADVVVDDFIGWVGANKGNGLWIADSDTWNGGTSEMVEPLGNPPEDMVRNSANILLAYDGDNNQIMAKLKVSAFVNAQTAKWASAGWVMEFGPVDTVGAGKPPWELEPWERKNDVDLTGCTGLEVTLKFSANKQLWIELYNPFTAKDFPLAPPYGWRFVEPTGNMVTRVFNLGNFGGPTTKWTDPANTKPLDRTKISRLKFMFEGQEGPAVTDPPPFDNDYHTLTIKSVRLLGPIDACKPRFYTPGAAIRQHRQDKAGFTFTTAPGRLIFGKLARLGDLNIQVRDLTGKSVAQGMVNENTPALATSGLRNGIYTVQVTGPQIRRSFSFTVLN